MSRVEVRHGMHSTTATDTDDENGTQMVMTLMRGSAVERRCDFTKCQHGRGILPGTPYLRTYKLREGQHGPRTTKLFHIGCETPEFQHLTARVNRVTLYPS